MPTTLAEARDTLARVLRWPQNMGVELRTVQLPGQPGAGVLALFVSGLADEELVRLWVIEPLTRTREAAPSGALAAEWLITLLPAPRLRLVADLTEAISGALAGATVLFIDGANAAVVVETAPSCAAHLGMRPPRHPIIFSNRLDENVALLRHRLRDPALRAEPQRLPSQQGSVALVYLARRAEPDLLAQLRRWLLSPVGATSLRQGLVPASPGWLGRLPRFATHPHPDAVAALLEAGYVALLMDRLPYAYVAPVTAPALFLHPGDQQVLRPVAGLLRSFRVLLAGLVLLAPAIAVALMEYHQEMFPTPVLLALAASRENMSIPFIGEMLLMLMLQEVIREAPLRLSLQVTTGQALVAGVIFNAMLVLFGIVGPVAGAVSSCVAFASLGLPTYDLAFLTRSWRWYLVLAAGFFGLYGVGAVLFTLTCYLVQSSSFGTPFVVESGLGLARSGPARGRLKGREWRGTAGVHR